jgi:hypothetical protein
MRVDKEGEDATEAFYSRAPAVPIRVVTLGEETKAKLLRPPYWKGGTWRSTLCHVFFSRRNV